MFNIFSDLLIINIHNNSKGVKMKNIVNIINFVRGVEPRPNRNIDLLEPVREQLRLLKEFNMKGTFLLQYDALIDSTYTDMIRSHSDYAEAGIWFEIVQPLVEKIGETWHGRYSWDWYCDVGFLIGYEPNTRLRLIDECMEKFKEIFGKYPKSVGSWHIDAVSLKYLSEKYSVSACCICRDQVGIDGYTMQGGYFNQAYYPSINNMFCPANSKDTQISLPVFRMLGSDPIYEYDCQICPDTIKFGCPTLEPVSNNYGGCDAWCDWFFRENFNGSGISFQYTQVGQENSFGWKAMKKGLTYQMSQIKKLSEVGKVEIMTLSESGDWYKSKFSLTPPAAQAVTNDYRNLNKKSIWYNSRFYRANLIYENGTVRFRDFYIFNDEFPEKYLKTRCETHSCEYRNLPIMDAVLYTDTSSDECHAGIYLTNGGEPINWTSLQYKEDGSSATVTLSGNSGKLTICFSEKCIEIVSDIEGLVLHPIYNRNYAYGKKEDQGDTFGSHNNRTVLLTHITDASVTDNKLSLTFSGITYGFDTQIGSFADDFSVHSKHGNIKINILTRI